MLDHYAFYLKTLAHSVGESLRAQCMDGTSPFYGGLEEISQGVTGPGASVGLACRLAEGYCTPGQPWHGDGTLPERACLAMEYALRRQHEDGTIDLVTTNFHDASETAFALQRLVPVRLRLKAGGQEGAAKRLASLMDRFIDRGADGLLAGGFHTPNHRWVHASALALCWRATGRTECLDRMRAYLNEGIDCDEEGEYTERSSGLYNIVCDRSFILLAEATGRDDLLEPVARNLTLAERYFEADHTVNTLNSTRQDAGSSPDWRIYYDCYLYMALKTGDPGFAWIADEMLRESAGEPLFHEQGPGLFCEFMPALMSDPAARRRLAALEGEPVRVSYASHFEASGIVRARQGDLTLTMVRDQPLFAMLRFGTHPVWLRLAGCFYARGQFEPQAISDLPDGGWRLSFSVRWGYKGPLPERQPTSDWRAMDHSVRPDVFMQDFGFDVDVRFREGGASFDIASRGQSGVPVKLELLFEPGGLFSSEGVSMRARPGDYVYPSREVTYRFADRHAVIVSGAFHSHCFGENMRGALPGDSAHFFVAMTGETPARERVELAFE